MNEKEWVAQALQFYRPMEFFSDQAGLSDEELAEELIERRQKIHSDSYVEIDKESREEAAKEHEEWEIVAPAVFAEMALLGEDKHRIWWEDGEIDFGPGDNVYKKFLEDCSRISRQAFTISDVEEEWDGEQLEGVTFDWGEDRWRVCPNEMYGWIDFDILEQINDIIAETGYRFYMHWTGDQTSYIVVLSEEEKQKMEIERGWDFFDNEDEEE